MRTAAQINYSLYLQSAHWRTLRTSAIHRAGNRCEGCTGRSALEPHHIFYRTPWSQATTGELVALCAACHSVVHSREDQGQCKSLEECERYREVLIWWLRIRRKADKEDRTKVVITPKEVNSLLYGPRTPRRGRNKVEIEGL